MMRDALRAAVTSYVPSDDREATFRERMLELARASDPFSRKSFSPGHFTASAFVLTPARDALLLIHHKKLGRWLQPGGHIDPTDATPLDAARRELAEETGIIDASPVTDGLFDIDVHPIPARPDEPAHEHFDLRVLLVSPRLDLAANDEVEAVRWVPLHEVATTHTDESVLRALRKIEKRRARSAR